MRIVLDTNVVVSALLKKGSVPSVVLDIALDPKITLIYNTAILAEYIKVLHYPKFQFTKEEIFDFVNYVRSEGLLVELRPLSKHLPDRSDDIFLSAAIRGEADFLITGNIKDFPSSLRENIKVTTPIQFLEIYSDQANSLQ